jgi:hypothetical protein
MFKHKKVSYNILWCLKPDICGRIQRKSAFSLFYSTTPSGEFCEDNDGRQQLLTKMLTGNPWNHLYLNSLCLALQTINTTHYIWWLQWHFREDYSRDKMGFIIIVHFWTADHQTINNLNNNLYKIMNNPHLVTITNHAFEGENPLGKWADKGRDTQIRNQQKWHLIPTLTWTEERGMLWNT